TSQLTAFYLSIATGGAVGGLFVAVLSPLVFTDYFELHWGLLLCGGLFLIVCVAARRDVPKLQAGETMARHAVWDDWRWAGCALPLAGFAGLDWFVHRTSLHHHAVSKAHLQEIRIGLWSIVIILAGFVLITGALKTFRHWK